MGMFNGKKGPKPELAYAAVKTSNIASLKELLSKGCDPTAHHDEMTGDTALHLASNKGRLDMVQLMIEHGAKLDVQNKLGQTALHCAAGYGTVPLVKLLLDKGADKTVTDGEGQTPGALAKAYGQEDTAAMLG
mmetsp:Transcript_9611/g.29252  ORF Transcript_9611/g.29252 Transcript_9611/m.29252 type:complete len:133 (+) Transcript_9611:1657-2055(+)